MKSGSTREWMIVIAAFLGVPIALVTAGFFAPAEDSAESGAMDTETTMIAVAPSKTRGLDLESLDPSRVVGPDEECSTCHIKETESWESSSHYLKFKDRHRSAEAKSILKAMGLRSMKRSSECYHCHSTPVEDEGKVRAQWGVSCESCHGAGDQFVRVHNRVKGDPGNRSFRWGQGKKEDPQDRLMRLGAARDRGMINAGMLYELGVRCFSCHVPGDEQLVNQGGHGIRNDFELVSWSQGEVRHSFVSSEGAPSGATNRPSTKEHRRRLYVVGVMVDLEMSFRRLLEVKELNGKYHRLLVERVNSARKSAEAILRSASLPGLSDVLSCFPESVTMTGLPSADGRLSGLADWTRKFSSSSHSDLSCLDPLIPTEVMGSAVQ